MQGILRSLAAAFHVIAASAPPPGIAMYRCADNVKIERARATLEPINIGAIVNRHWNELILVHCTSHWIFRLRKYFRGLKFYATFTLINLIK